MGIAHKEALQDVSRLVGVNHDSFSGGLGAGTDPNQRRHLFLLPQLFLLILQTKQDTEIEILYICHESQTLPLLVPSSHRRTPTYMLRFPTLVSKA